MMPHGRHVNSLATPYHMPIFDALALVRSPHLRGLATAQGDFHDLWPRTVARKLTTMGFLRHWGDVVFVNTIHPNRAQRTVKLSSSSPQVWLCSVGVNEGSPQASRPSRSGRACMHIPPILPYRASYCTLSAALTECFEKASRIRSRVSCALSCCCCCVLPYGLRRSSCRHAARGRAGSPRRGPVGVLCDG